MEPSQRAGGTTEALTRPREWGVVPKDIEGHTVGGIRDGSLQGALGVREKVLEYWVLARP